MNQVYAADILPPRLENEEDLVRVVREICDYLFLQHEGLEYTLHNLGVENFNATRLAAAGITVDEDGKVHLDE